MGGLSSGPGPGLCLLTLVVLIVAQQVQSAPVQEDSLSPQSRAQGYYDGSSSELSTGCYYNFQHYGEGDRIITNEPCLNCTCHNRMLMCYLRVCPFTKAIGQNCTIEKKPGQCCPLIICPEVPVQLLTSSTTTEHSESLPHRNQIGYGQYGTAIGHLDDYGCKINGEFYTNGAQIPGNIDKPCEVCYCIRNRTACIMQECTLQVEGCIPVYEEGLCCPVRYQCDYEYNYNAITTEQPRPTPGLVLTTTTSGPFECQHDNKWYADGAMVDTEDSCEHCYCMKGDIVCAVQECKPPFEKDGHNCTAMPPSPGKCCPDSYHCDGNEIVDESEPTFRQDRMHKFGQNNANITMSITSSTSSGDKQHSWHYGTSSNESEMPNRFTDEHDKDGTTKPGKPISDSDMMVTEGVPPTSRPLESGSHQVDGHGGGSEMRPMDTHTGMRPSEGQPSASQGHGVNTDNLLTISQVIQSIVQNQTNLFIQNKLNQTGKPEKKPSQYDDKIVFPTDIKLEKKPGTEVQTDEDSNPIEAHSGTTDFPNEYYGFTGSVPNTYAEQGGQPQKKPSIQKKPETTGTQESAGQPVSGENQDLEGHKQPVMAHNMSGGEHGIIQHAEKKPNIHRQPGMAGTLVLTDDEGNPIEIYEGATGEPQRVSGRPGSSEVHSGYGEQGRPQRPGMQEGATGLYGGVQEGFTGRPGGDGIYSSFDEYGQPQKKPVTHEKPADLAEEEKVMGSHDLTGTSGITTQPEIFGEHGHVGRPHKKPVTHKTTGTTDTEMLTEAYAGITGTSVTTGKPLTDEHGQPLPRPGADGDSGSQGKPQKRPAIHQQPGSQVSEDDTTEAYGTVTKTMEDLPGLHDIQTNYGENSVTGRPNLVHTDGHGEPVTDSYGDGGEYIYYDKYGKPHKRPTITKRPGTGSAMGGEHFVGTTEFPEVLTQVINSQDKISAQTKKPQIHKTPSMTPESDYTDEDGNPIEDNEDSIAADEFEIFYDKYGRPHKKPVTQIKPVSGVLTDEHGKPVGGKEGVTDIPEGFTGKPGTDDYQIFYDEHGRPHRRPVTHKKPVSGVLTDEQGKPVEGVEGVTDFPEGFTGKPGIDDHQIFYDEHGRPHRRPVTHKKPVSGVLTDEQGKPVEGVEGVTDFPEGFTGKPGTDDYQIFYDEHGRPHRRPVTHKKPDSGVLTDEHGKPIEEVEGVTDIPEGFTGKPGTDDYQIFYDEHGRPHRRPVTHKKPVSGVLTDEQGKPVEGVEGVTDFPEGFTGTPGTDDYQIFYDQYGRPYKRPVTHKKPVSGVLTDEHGKPIEEVEGVTDIPEGFTGKPGTDDYQIFYDEHGRPHRRPVTHKKPVSGVLTDEHGKPVSGVLTDEQGKPIEGVEGVTDFPEGFTGKPGTDDHQIFYDQYGRPYKRPVTHKKPVSGVLTDEHGKPIEGVTDFPEVFTGKPGTDDHQIFYDQYGRPYKRPVTHKKPDSGVLTDEHGKPVSGVLTDEQGKPIEGVEGVTDFPEGFTGKPGTDDHQIFYDEQGRPHKRPVVDKTPELDVGEVLTDDSKKPIDDVTKLPEAHGEVAEHDIITEVMIGYGHTDKPDRKPGQSIPGPEGIQILIDEVGSSTDYDGIKGTSESKTGKPAVDNITTNYGESERPEKRPDSNDKPGVVVVGDEMSTKPDVDIHPVHETKKPEIQAKPGENVMTDEKEHPFEATTGRPEEQTDQPGAAGSHEISLDKYGRPHKKPVSHKKPGEGEDTDEHGKPVEGVEEVTDFPEGFTGKPGTDEQQIFYDEHDRPHKKPITDSMTDEHSKPIDGVEGVTDFPEGFTGKPGIDDHQIFYDEHGRPHRRPVTHKKPVSGVLTDEHGKPVEGVTDIPEGFTGKPGTDDYQIFYDQHGHPYKGPEENLLTDEHGEPVEKLTESPESSSQDVVPDPYDRPVKKPISPTKPQVTGPDEDQKGMEESFEGITRVPESSSEGVLYDNLGRPQKEPGTHDIFEHGLPQGVQTEDGGDYSHYDRPHSRPSVNKEPGTDVSGSVLEDGENFTKHPNEEVYGEPGVQQNFFGETGRPQKKPVLSIGQYPSMTDTAEGQNHTDSAVGHVKPDLDVTQVLTDESDQRPIEKDTTEMPEAPATTPEKDKIGQTGQKDKKPDGPIKPDSDGIEGNKESLNEPSREQQKEKAGNDAQVAGDNQYSPPEKRPGVEDMTEKQPELDEVSQFYGEHGHTDEPQEIPNVLKKPGASIDKPTTDEDGTHIEMTTELPETETDEMDVVYDNYGRPHKRPITHKKPEVVSTDKKPQPDKTEGIKDIPEGLSGKPEADEQQVYHDPSGTIHKKPVTNEDVMPVEGAEVTPEPLQTERPEDDSQEILYDEHGRPYKRPVVQKKPEDGGMIGEVGKPLEQGDLSTENPEEFIEKPDNEIQQIHYDQYGRPHKKPTIEKKPDLNEEEQSAGGEKVGEVEKDRPSEGENEATELIETFTSKPDGDEQQIVYDEYGRPHKKPITDGMTDEHGKPIEGVTDFPEGFTGKPGTDEHQIFYDEHGRPYKRPVVDKKPEDDSKKPIDDVTKSPEAHAEGPEHDITTEVMIGYGHTDKPDTKPGQSIPGSEGVPTMEEIESITKSPESFTGKPESSTGHSVLTEISEGVAETFEHGKPLGGEEKPSQEETKKPEQDEIPHVHVEYDDNDQPQIPSEDHKQPEQDDTHPGYDGQKPTYHKQPGVTEDGETAVVEDLTQAPVSGNVEQPMISGEHDHTGGPYKRPVKPSVLGTSEPEIVSGTPEGKPGIHDSSDKQDVPVDEATTEEIPEKIEDHVVSDKKKPGLESDEIATIAPGKETAPEEDQILYQKPDVEGSQLTDDVTETFDNGITEVPNQHAQKKPGEQPNEEAAPVDKGPGTHSQHETMSDKLGVGSTEIYYDNLGRPQKRPVHTQPSDTNESPEMGLTGIPTISSEHGVDDSQNIPLITSAMDGAHTTEGAYRPDEIGKPDSTDEQGKKPELVGGDLTHDMEPEGPHEKPVLKPGLGDTGVVVDETGKPDTELGVTDKPEAAKPDVHHKETGLEPSKTPDTQEIDEGVESTTKLSPNVAHDTNIPGFYDGQTPADHKPEENEIFGVPVKDVTGVDDDGAPKLPEIPVDGLNELSRPQKKPTVTDHGSEDSHTTLPDILHHYPQQQLVPSKTPEGDHASVDDDTTTEDDDESLIITTDESGEEATDIPEVLHGDHEKPESDFEEKPSDTKTEIPSHVVPGQAQHGSTPGLGSQSDDFTTPFYGAQDASGAPVTEKDGAAHVTTRKPVEHAPGMSTGFDEDSKPDDVTTSNGIVESSFPTTIHVMTDKDLAKPASEDRDPALTGGIPTLEGDGDKSQVPEKDSNQVTPSGISDSKVSHEGTRPGLLPTQDTDGVTNHDVGVLPGVITPVSTPEGTHGVPESAGSVPSGEMHSAITTTMETPGKVPEIKPVSHLPPHVFIPYLPPDDDSSTKHPILIDEGLHESSVPFDDILNNLANILRPSQTTEETEGTTEDHGEVPGEGSCFMDGVTYQHNADIPPLSPCHTKCTCISSIIHCLSLKCPPPPEDVSHCTVIHEENSCCPIYVCGTDVSPTLPVENHEGETTTDTSADKDESTSAHDYEPSKPTKPLAGTISQKPEGGIQTDEDVPIKHETDDETSQKPKPGVVSEVPEESDKGTPLTEKPEEESVGEPHASQGMDHVMSSKPESTGAEAATESKVPTKISEDGTTPDTSHVAPGEPQSGYHPISFDTKHPSTSLPIYFGTEKPELPYQSHKKPESVDHVLDTEKPHQEETEEPSSGVETVKPHGDKQKPEEMGGTKPDEFVVPTTYKPVYHETTKPVHLTGGLGQEDKTPDKFAAGEGESLKPEESEKETESSEVQKYNETEIHSTLEEQEPVKKPVKKPDEMTSSKGKPQSGQDPTVTEEPEHQTTEGQGENVHVDTTSEEQTIHSPSGPHGEPEMSVKPPYSVETPTFTTLEPHTESFETEEPYRKPQITDKPENDFVQSSSQKPGQYHESKIPDQSSESDPSIKRPVTHDKPSEEEEQKQTFASGTGRPTEVLQTQKPRQPISTDNRTETTPTEGDLVSTEKTHVEVPRPPHDTAVGGEKPSEKPEEPDETLTYSTSQPIDQSESGKPLVSFGEATDLHKEPHLEHSGLEEASVTTEGALEESATEVYPSPASEGSAHTTMGSHEETPEEFEHIHEKQPSVHPTSMDNESAFTTEEPSTEDKKPLGKPETEAYPTLTDEKSSTEKPEESSGVEQMEIKPESEEGLVGRPVEGESVVKKPAVSEKPIFEDKVPPGEEETDLVHTTASHVTDGRPEETKPQQAQDFSSTIRPKPTGQLGVSAQNKPQTDDIPEEILLHPTRMPGTYETERPDDISDIEEDAIAPSQKPHTDNENLATISPEGIIRPITKRPIYGTGKPVVSDDKESTTPGYPSIQLGPQTNQSTDEPEELFDVTEKPIFDIMSGIPEDFAELFGIKPPTVHGEKPDKYDKPEHTTHFFVPDLTTRLPDLKPQTVDHVKRPIHSTNGTHFIQYVPYKEGEAPLVPEGATLGELLERPDGEKYWPVIYMKFATTTPGAEIPQQPFKPIPQQVFNGTHFIQYVPYDDDDDKEPEVPEGAVLGQPQRGPDGQIYWPIIGNKPIMSPEDKPVTEQPYPWQVYNGTHFIQYVPFKDGVKPEVPENATLGELETTPNGQKFWPIISNKPIPEEDSLTSQRPVQSQPEQIFNGTHFIQFAPYNDGQEPEMPEEATLGQPQKGPDGQIYWPIIDTKPLPVIPDKLEPITEQPSPSLQVFNGTNFIQYVPFKDGEKPEVPEGATLGQPQKGPDNQIYWPIIYMRPQPVSPQGSFPEQVYNGTHFIQYVPYKDGHKPEVPSHATIGEPQKAPDGQEYWPIIYMKPVTAKPEDEVTTGRPFQAAVFNGTHFIQYVPYTEGFEPDIPDEATLGKPEKKPDGEMYWPIIYQKLPTRPKPDAVQHYPGQFFNGTHFVQYLPYRPSHKPYVPEGVTVSQPQKGPDGQMYWMIVSTKPLPTIEEKPIGPQFFNGTHFIQYVPYEKEKEPEVPEGATLGKPETGSGGQQFWPIIYEKPLPGVPITHQKPLDKEQGTPFDPYKGQVYNGTHYVQYVPYVPGQTPNVPEAGVLGQLTKRPDGQTYWPVIFQRPVPDVPVTYEDQIQTFDPIKGPIFNGTHYVQYVPYKPGERPTLPDGATLGQPTRRPDGQLYWPVYYLRPVQEFPVQGPMFWSPYDYIKPQPEQVYNGTHFIQYLPYNPTRMPEVPEGATLGQPQKGPGGQMYWVIISDKPLPAQTFNDTHVVQYVTPVTPEQEKPLIDQNKPIQVFNGSHYIQYVPYTPGQKPILPEGASLGQPTKGPEGQMYWPIIYMKPQPGKPSTNQQVPIFWDPSHDQLEPVSGQIFNGTHYIRFIKYDPRIKPIAPEGATISEPQRRPDGQLYWVVASKKPLFDVQVSVKQQPGQIFNGTHYIQYVPYNSSQMPQVPEGAVLGHPQKGPEGQMYWVIISDKPLPAQPGTQYVQYVTPVTPGDDQMLPRPMFNGTHYIQYVPYQPAQVPRVPQDATLGELHKGPGGEMYWSIIYRKPPQSLNETHYIQYVPDNATGADVSKPSAGTDYLQLVNATSKPAQDHPFWSYGQYAPRPENGSLPTVNKFPSQKPGTEEHAFWTYGHEKPQNVSENNYAYKPTTEYPSWFSGQIHNTTKAPEISKLPSGQYGGGDHSKPGYEYESGYYKPEKPERPSTPEDSYETIDEDHLIEYPSGSDYDETQEQPYGPGTCRYAGKVYVSAQQIPRDDPCDFCFCFRSDIICLQQSCPPPIPGCHEEPIQGFCCPRYECHVRMATLLNVTSTTTTTTTTLPPHFLSHVYKGAAGRTGCFIQGKAYRVGQAIPSASGPCMDCMCGGDGKMKCEPKVCTPEPMVRQMMVSSEKPTTVNHR